MGFIGKRPNIYEKKIVSGVKTGKFDLIYSKFGLNCKDFIRRLNLLV